MYYILLPSPLTQHGIVDYPRLKNDSFVVGRSIREQLADPLPFPADTTAEAPPPDFTQRVIPVMSDRMVATLRAAGVDNLQCFRAKLQNPQTNEVWTNYLAVNVLGCVSCADLERSEYSEIGGGLLHFSWLVIDPDRAGGALFFRLAESPSTIVAHRKVGDALYGTPAPRLTGFRFWPTAAEDVAKLRSEN